MAKTDKEAAAERVEAVRKRLGESLKEMGYRPPDKAFIENHAAERPDFEIWDYGELAEGLVICTCQPTLDEFKKALSRENETLKAYALAEAAIVYPELRLLDPVIAAKPGLLWMIGNFILMSSGFWSGGKSLTPEGYLSKS